LLGGVTGKERNPYLACGYRLCNEVLKSSHSCRKRAKPSGGTRGSRP